MINYIYQHLVIVFTLSVILLVVILGIFSSLSPLLLVSVLS